MGVQPLSSRGEGTGLVAPGILLGSEMATQPRLSWGEMKWPPHPCLSQGERKRLCKSYRMGDGCITPAISRTTQCRRPQHPCSRRGPINVGNITRAALGSLIQGRIEACHLAVSKSDHPCLLVRRVGRNQGGLRTPCVLGVVGVLDSTWCSGGGGGGGGGISATKDARCTPGALTIPLWILRFRRMYEARKFA